MSYILNLLASLPGPQPEQAWFLLPVVLGTLGLTALIDARTGRVPDSILFIGYVTALGSSAAYEGWNTAFIRVAMTLAVVAVLWFVNRFFRYLWQRDAFGMGDAKWTGLAVLGLSLSPALWAWIYGAWLGVAWMGLRWLAGLIWPQLRGEGYVHFAPFLFIGLLISMALKSAGISF